ncbi:hypothetical protein [Enterococcus sp. AZ196]|uniref:hypothetical protein n=1 Tax=Enterococcus sp. AZ196 TaxID=2774659 RepID=UPI003D2B5DEA
MILKVYLGKFMFHLPMREQALLNKMQKLSPKYAVNKESFHKLFPISDLEGNENIIVVKQKTNIFYLNLLIKILNVTGEEISEPKYYNNEFILSELERLLQTDLKKIPFEEISNRISNLILNDSKTGKSDQIIELEEKESEEHLSASHLSDNRLSAQFSLENVEFNLGWIAKAEEEIKRKELEDEEEQD